MFEIVAKVGAYVLARLNEYSTWRGVILVLTAVDVLFHPERAQASIAIGLAAAGLVASVFPNGQIRKNGNGTKTDPPPR